MTANSRLAFALLSCASLAFACGGTGGSGVPGPCDAVPPPAECTEACGLDADCADGFHCGTDATCTAECTPTGGECAAGASCDDRGNCRPDPGGGADAGPNGCPSVAVALTPETPYVMLVIDQSGSMDEDFGGGLSRWEAVEQALVDRSNGVVARLADRVVFGAALYTYNRNEAGGVCPRLKEVAPALDNFTAIANLMAANAPVADTPTAEALTEVTAGFPVPNPERPGPRLIVLATDGNPDNCVDPDAHDLGSQRMSESAVQAAFSSGIKTFVLSVGADVSQAHLQRLANAGIGQPLDSGTGEFFVANDPSQLVGAFDEIIRGARSCTFQLDSPVDAGRVDEGTVRLNGTELLFGTDWRLIDDRTLELLGEACDTFLSQDDVVLDAEFPCGVVIL